MRRSLYGVRLLIWIALAIHWLTIFILTHLPAQHLPNVKVNDKIEHMLAYFVLSVLLYGALRIRAVKYTGWIVLLTCAVYGALDEYLQFLLPIHRDASVWDWCADLGGTVIGVGLCLAVLDRVLARFRDAPAVEPDRSDTLRGSTTAEQ